MALKTEAILFDADGVIQMPARSVEAMMRDVFGHLPQDYRALVRDIVETEKPCQWGDGEFAARLPPVLAGWGYGAGTAQRLIRAWTTVYVSDEILSVIDALRSHTPCWLASNQEPSRARHMSERLGYRNVFDREFYSCDLGVAKPDPAYFASIAESAAVAPDALVFVDDREENVGAARTCGLRAAVFNLRHEDAPADALSAVLGSLGVESGLNP